MKVVERKEWEKTFKHECTCPQCESKLEAESSDIRYEASNGDGHDFCPERFWVNCPVCQCVITILAPKIPKYIQILAARRGDPKGPRD